MKIDGNDFKNGLSRLIKKYRGQKPDPEELEVLVNYIQHINPVTFRDITVGLNVNPMIDKISESDVPLKNPREKSINSIVAALWKELKNYTPTHRNLIIHSIARINSGLLKQIFAELNEINNKKKIAKSEKEKALWSAKEMQVKVKHNIGRFSLNWDNIRLICKNWATTKKEFGFGTQKFAHLIMASGGIINNKTGKLEYCPSSNSSVNKRQILLLKKRLDKLVKTR